MNRIRSRSRAARHRVLFLVLALFLALALLLPVVLPGPALGADDAANAADDATAAAEEQAASPAPQPSPVPAFDPTGLRLRADLFADALVAPVYLADDGAKPDCLYVVERGGTVKVIDRTGEVQRVFLDISKLVDPAPGPEQGLHSIAFHPRFAKNGRFFVHYNDKDDAAVIAEFRGTACRSAQGKPVKTLLTEKQSFINNNAGWIGFGPDGYLYVPLGDGGGPAPGDPNGVGQDAGARLSKVLRLDVNRGRRYDIPPTNPFVRKDQDGKLVPRGGFPREAFARGLRDPRRSSFDRKTGDLWIGDVGQTIEEINRIPAGVTKRGNVLNFGWSHLEGESTCHPNVPDCDPSQYEPPVHFYDKVSPHVAITGGYVYRGEAYPELDGVYLFSDAASGYVWGLDADALAEGLDVPVHQLLDLPQGIVSFGEDDRGELYLVSLDGSIFRLGLERT